MSATKFSQPNFYASKWMQGFDSQCEPQQTSCVSNSQTGIHTMPPRNGADFSINVDGKIYDFKKGDQSFTVYDGNGTSATNDDSELIKGWGDPHYTNAQGQTINGKSALNVGYQGGGGFSTRTCSADGGPAIPGAQSYTGGLTIYSKNGVKVNVDMHLGDNSPIDSTISPSNVGQNTRNLFSGQNHQPGAVNLLLGKQGFMDPMTGASVDQARLDQLENQAQLGGRMSQCKSRETGRHRRQSQDLFDQGYLTPSDSREFSHCRRKDFSDNMRQQCRSNLNRLLDQMRQLSNNGSDCNSNLSNHDNGELDGMLSMLGQRGGKFGSESAAQVGMNPLVFRQFDPTAASKMDPKAAARIVGTYMKSMGISCIGETKSSGSNGSENQGLAQLSMDPTVSPIVRNACSNMLQNPEIFKNIETMDVPGQDHWSGVDNFLNYSNQQYGNWNPDMSMPPASSWSSSANDDNCDGDYDDFDQFGRAQSCGVNAQIQEATSWRMAQWMQKMRNLMS